MKAGWLLRLIGAILCVLIIPVVYSSKDTGSGAERHCGGSDVENEHGGKTYVPKYKCPVRNGPKKETECCEPAKYNCCRERKFYEIDQMTGIIIAVTVVLCCLLITIAVITCCFWDKCPLYMACRAEAKPDYIAHPDEMSALTTSMPSENAKNVKVYIPKQTPTRPNNYV